MAHWTIPTTRTEAHEFYMDEKKHLIRGKVLVKNMKVGDTIQLQLMDRGKPIFHPVERRVFTVTVLDDYRTVPIIDVNSCIISVR